MSTIIEERLTIPAESVSLNPDASFEWASAVLAFVSRAAQAGRSVELAAVEQAYSPAQVARMVGVSKSGVHRRISSGAIRATKVGSRYRITAAEVQRYRWQLQSDLAELLANDF